MRVHRYLRRGLVLIAIASVAGLVASGVAQAMPRSGIGGVVSETPYRTVMLIANEITDIQADGDGFGAGCGDFGFRFVLDRGNESAEVHGPAGALEWQWHGGPKPVGVVSPISVCTGASKKALFPYYADALRLFPDPNLAGTFATAWLLDGPISADGGSIKLNVAAYEEDPGNIVSQLEGDVPAEIDLNKVGVPQALAVHIDDYSYGGEPVDFVVQLTAYVDKP